MFVYYTQGLTMDEKLKSISDSVKAMIENLEGLPSHAMMSALSHYDYLSLLILLDTLIDFEASRASSLANLEDSCNDEICDKI